MLFCFSTRVYGYDNVVINEFLLHPGDEGKEWIEFYNPEKINISNYFIDDDISFTEDNKNSPIKSLIQIFENNSIYPFLK